MKHPYVIFNSQVRVPSVRRIVVWVIMFILTFISFFLILSFSQSTHGPYSFIAIGLLFTFLGRKLTGNISNKDTLIALRFDRQCRNFSWIQGNKTIHFRAEEARLLKSENDQLFFDVRGETLFFPAWVSASGNLRTMLHLKGGGEYLFLDFFSAVTEVQMLLRISIDQKLEVRALDFYDGNPRPYNRIF